MLKLLKSDDKLVMDSSNFAKNAVFYKDMLCFYEAYDQILKHRDNLPNFCYLKGDEICLEGLCLLMKMYATEFKFETLKLTLDYLKILYYTIASYAEEDSDEVDREVIIKEFDEYRIASIEFCNNQREELETKQKSVDETDKEIRLGQKKCQKMLKNGKATKFFSIVFLILSILSISAPVLVLNYKPENKLLLWGSVAIIVVGFVLTIALIVISKKIINTESDLSFHIQTLKKNIEPSLNELNQMKSKYYKVVCEKFEYKTCFPEIFSRYTKVLSIEEIINKAKNYKMLSYNIVYDINRLFKSQQKEINEIVTDIENIVMTGDYKNQFCSVYSKICEQDWLYYNAEIRLHFLKKFTDAGEREHDWKLEIDGQKIKPFEVNIRELSQEMIAFSSEKDKKMISAPLSEFVKTKYFRNLEQLNFKNGYTVEEFKKVKSNYLKHFYRFDIMSKLNGVFYDKKDNLNIRNTEVPIDEMESVPTLVDLKLKLIENLTGLGNSDANVIKSISQSLFNDDSQDIVEIGALSENDIEYPKFTSQKMEEFDEYFVYEVAGQKKIGYKID